MPRNQNAAPAQETPVSAVDFINHYHSDVEGFEVDLSMQVEQRPDGNVVYAGITIQMGHSDMPAFIPSNVLRQLADEADAMTQKAIDEANARRG
jgi:hypothetical protein